MQMDFDSNVNVNSFNFNIKMDYDIFFLYWSTVNRHWCTEVWIFLKQWELRIRTSKVFVTPLDLSENDISTLQSREFQKDG